MNDRSQLVSQMESHWKLGLIDDVELTAFFILAHAQNRSRNWLNGKRNYACLPNCKANPLFIQWISTVGIQNDSISALQFILNNRLRNISENAISSLLHWKSNLFPLKLEFALPTPFEILRLQAQGKRIVTLPLSDFTCDQIQQKHDVLSFVLHDLAHAHHFFVSPFSTEQIGIYKKLLLLEESGILTPLRRSDEHFDSEMNYLISDMNTHPLHLLKCFKAILLCYFLRKNQMAPKARLSPEDRLIFDQLCSQVGDLWNLAPTTKTAFLHLNYEETEEEKEILIEASRKWADNEPSH